MRILRAAAWVVFALTVMVAATGASAAEDAKPFETKAAQAYMIEANTGTVLFAKDGDMPFPPASLAKLMTMEIVFESLRSGELTPDRTFPVSEHAWRTGGAPSRTSTMFAALKSQIAVSDLIQGVIVQGANDGCIILAEGMAGSEDAFATRMTERARALGLGGLGFRNATGLPAEGQSVTAREMTLLAAHIWRSYPDQYRIYAQPDFTWNKILQRNRNPLLAMDLGADGMGTGATEGAGFSIVGSAERGGKRIIVTLGGLASDKERAEETRRMIAWGMSAFERREIFAAASEVGRAKVFGGASPTIGLAAARPVAVLLPVEGEERLSARIVYQGPVQAPVEAGTEIGLLRIQLGDRVVQETTLLAMEDVGSGSITQRAMSAAEELLVGWFR